MTDKTPALPEPEDDIVAQLRGCAAFRRDRGEVKSPGLMDQAAARLQEALDRADRAEKERDEAQEIARDALKRSGEAIAVHIDLAATRLRATTALAALSAAEGVRPIDTAPKDGSVILWR